MREHILSNTGLLNNQSSNQSVLLTKGVVSPEGLYNYISTFLVAATGLFYLHLKFVLKLLL
jgi:hypothetical protein